MGRIEDESHEALTRGIHANHAVAFGYLKEPSLNHVNRFMVHPPLGLTRWMSVSLAIQLCFFPLHVDKTHDMTGR